MGRGKTRARRYEEPTIGNQQLGEFRSTISTDATIDDETRSELLGQATQGIKAGKFTEINSTLAKAREGVDPLFKGRKLFQGMRETALGQPGRGQTILTK